MTPQQPNTMENKPGAPSRRWWWLLLVIVLGAAAYFFWGRSTAPADSSGAANSQGRGKGRRGMGPGGENSVLPVGVTTAAVADVHIYLSGLGSVTPEATATVKSRVDGQLMKLHFKEGETVKAGALLAELDPRPYQVLVTQAEGQFGRDSALLKAAQIDLKRYQTLLAQDSIASQLVDTQAALVKQYEGTVKTDQGTLDNARLQLLYSRVTAPITGRIGLRQVDLGNIVHSSDTNGVVIITQLQPISAIFSIPEDNIPGVMKQIQAGKTLPAEAWDRAQKNNLATGKFVTIDNQVDATTGTVKLRAVFPNTDYALFPSQFVNIRMLLDTLIGATVIPSAAIQRGSSGNFVYVVKEDKTVTIRPVTIGPVEGENTSIAKGISPGEIVVVDGVDKLREGAKVEPVKRGAGGAIGDAANPANTGKRGHRRQGAAGSASASPSPSAGSSAAPPAAATAGDKSKPASHPAAN
ncbi:MdtA/MuxA family multidrug efflux RND transporter periplasmic adaptor subunit [Glaciimonas immobilis]|uniref:Multidrug efflux system membrane fusion protein n=1 Tax=Glaciimonas immobilis TaxID=728004 RepID=A0A840S0H8_9BURK|nr:MdtA/MuxA family multidrug efflux RND transporter periplasmic adaptor subunit [Glaciimonas immobilis]MBB5202099.1 multidrug efflux system membrane fusion protein [Glaciimonas immobilis]